MKITEPNCILSDNDENVKAVDVANGQVLMVTVTLSEYRRLVENSTKYEEMYYEKCAELRDAKKQAESLMEQATTLTRMNAEQARTIRTAYGVKEEEE